MLSRTHKRPLDIFDEFFDPFGDFGLRYEMSVNSVTSVTETGDLKIAIDLPGVKKSDVQLSAESGVLTLEAKRQETSIKRSWTISEKYDISSCEAQLEDGVLTVIVKARPGAQKRRIEIK